jgi:hypothetical protein
VDTGFPLTEHSSILLFIDSNFSLVLQFCKLSCSLLVHFFLKVCSLDSIFFIHLLQNIHLMILSISGFLSCSSSELSILLSNGGFNLMFLVCYKPLFLLFICLLKKNILFTGLIDVFKEIDSGLLFSCPLSFSHFILSFSFLLNKFVHKFLVSSLVVLCLFVVLLKFHDFLSSLSSLCLLDIFKSLFSLKPSCEKFLISLFFNTVLDVSEFSLSSVMVYELKVSFSIENEFLSLSLFIRFDFSGPLIF